MIFIYTINFQIFGTQNLKINNAINNSMYASTQPESIRNHRIDSIDEKK